MIYKWCTNCDDIDCGTVCNMASNSKEEQFVDKKYFEVSYDIHLCFIREDFRR